MTYFEFLREETNTKELQWFFNSREIYITDFGKADELYKTIAQCETPEAMAHALADAQIFIGLGDDPNELREWLMTEYEYISDEDFVPSWEQEAAE